MTAKKKASNNKVKVVPELITIEAGVPIPQVISGRGKYPFEQLNPGDSFLKKCTADKMATMKSSLNSAAKRVATKFGGRTFLCVERPEEGGVRCWRMVVARDEPRDKEEIVDDLQARITPSPADEPIVGNEEEPTQAGPAPVDWPELQPTEDEPAK